MIFFSCSDDNGGDDPDCPIYCDVQEITYPPDVFDLMMNLKTIGNYSVKIKFDTNAVWKIKKLSANSALLWLQRQYSNSTATLYIQTEIEVGLEGEFFYKLLANNNSFPEIRNLIIKFEKQPNNYDTFEPKF